MISDNVSSTEPINRKEIIAKQVKGNVKWFNVDLGYGFIHREDTNEDVFVHHTAIIKYNPKHQLSSLADGEWVEFDVVHGDKGLEASNVSGPDGKQVKGSRFASNFYAGQYRYRQGANYWHGRGRFPSRGHKQMRPAKDGRDRAKTDANDDKGGLENGKDDENDLKELINGDIGTGKASLPAKKRPKNRYGFPVRKFELAGSPHGGLKGSISLPDNLDRYSKEHRVGKGRRGFWRRPFVRRFRNGTHKRGRRTNAKQNGVENHKEKDADNNRTSGDSPSGKMGNDGYNSGSEMQRSSAEDKSQLSRNSAKDGHGFKSYSQKRVRMHGPQKRVPNKTSTKASRGEDSAGSKSERNRSSFSEDGLKEEGAGDKDQGNQMTKNKRRRNYKKRPQRGGDRSSIGEVSTQTQGSEEAGEPKVENTN